jgi:hypothetical protein
MHLQVNNFNVRDDKQNKFQTIVIDDRRYTTIHLRFTLSFLARNITNVMNSFNNENITSLKYIDAKDIGNRT